MDEYRMPDERDLEELAGGTPEFDPEAVRARVLGRIAPVHRRPPLLRGLAVAALVCAISVSAMAAADMATNGRITAALGLRAEPEVPPPAVEEPLPEPEIVPPPASPAPPPVTEEPKELPELDPQVQDALALTPEQAQQLRPALQQVDGAATAKEITMSVIQMLGDRNNAWIKVRFDFPEQLPVGQRMRFRQTDFGLEDGSWGWQELEQTDRSATYLLKIHSYDALPGREITLTVRDYGYSVNRDEDGITVTLGDEGVTLVTVDPQGNMVIEEENVTVPEDLDWQEGYARTDEADGTLRLYYDGSRGKQLLRLSAGEVTTSAWEKYPNFEVVVEGEWSHRWTLDYADLSRSWSGREKLFQPAAEVTALCVSPLSWEIVLEGDIFALLQVEEQLGDARLRYADGTEVPLTLKQNHGSYLPLETEGVYTMSIRGLFESMPELEGVSALVLQETAFPLGE